MSSGWSQWPALGRRHASWGDVNGYVAVSTSTISLPDLSKLIFQAPIYQQSCSLEGFDSYTDFKCA